MLIAIEFITVPLNIGDIAVKLLVRRPQLSCLLSGMFGGAMGTPIVAVPP